MKDERDEEAVIKAFYQRRRLRFEGLFFGELRENKTEGTPLTLDDVRKAWRAACMKAEPEFSEGVSELRDAVKDYLTEYED